MEDTDPTLAANPQVAALIYQVLVPAMAGGLPHEEAIYEQLCEHYARIDGRAYDAWREDMLKILNFD